MEFKSRLYQVTTYFSQKKVELLVIDYLSSCSKIQWHKHVIQIFNLISTFDENQLNSYQMLTLTDLFAYCIGQIVTLFKIVTCVPSYQKCLKRTTNSSHQLAHCGSKEKTLGLAPSLHSTRGRPEISL